MKHLAPIVFVALIESALTCPTASAGEPSGVPTASRALRPGSAPTPAAHKKMKMKKSIKMHEPMTTPMARPGMMKEDVHKQMMQKDAAMKDTMEEEEQDMK